MKSLLFTVALGLGVLAGATSASAAGSLFATYYKATGNGGDFEGACCSTTVTVANTLGANGLPVFVSSTAAVTEVDGVTGELLWWTPNGSHIVQDGPTTLVALPFNDSSLFAPQGTGSANGGANGFQTAIFSGGFSTIAANTLLNFNVTSDDDIFMFIDNQLVPSGLSGIHGPSNSVFNYNVAGTGAHTFNLFYADRHTTQAELHFNVEGATFTPGIPEPATWAMMILGFGGVGAMVRRRRLALAV